MKFQTSNIDSFISKIKHPKLDRNSLIAMACDKEYLTQAYVQSLYFKELFHSKFPSVSTELAKDLNTKNLQVGQMVTFTNEYGVSFINNEILGFDNDPDYGRCVYLNTSSYWFAASVDSLTVQEGLIGLTETDLDSISNEYKDKFLPWDLKIIRQNAA